MLSRPMHPIHYLVGSTIYSKTIFAAWRNEPYTYKASLFFVQALFFELTGYYAGLGIGLSFVAFIGVLLMSVGSLMVVEKGASLRQKISIVFLDAVLPFQALLLMSWLVNCATFAIIFTAGLYSENLPQMFTTLTIFLIMYYSIWMASVTKKDGDGNAVFYIPVSIALLYFFLT